jgi:predicted nucleic acid-binding protein
VRLYLDAAPVIYLVEHINPYRAMVQTSLARPGVELVATELTRLECRVGAVRRANIMLLREFDEFFDVQVDELVPISHDVMDQATDLRAQQGFATPDAIQVAAALVASCDVFLTNDRRLSRAVGITMEIIA